MKFIELHPLAQSLSIMGLGGLLCIAFDSTSIMGIFYALVLLGYMIEVLRLTKSGL